MAKDGEARLLARGTAVLSVIGMSPHPMRFGDIQQRTGLAKATLSRILATLRDGGFVQLEPNGRHYKLGPQMLDLAAATKSDLVNRIAFKMEAQRLADLWERPVCHWTREGGRMRLLEQVWPFGMDSFGSSVDHPDRQAKSLERTAPGVAVLAAMPPDLLASTLVDLPDYQNKAGDLSMRLGFSAATGFSIWDFGNGQYDIAAAVTDADGTPIAALCVSTLPGESSDAERHQIGRQLSSATQKVSAGPNNGPRKRDVQTLVSQPIHDTIDAALTVIETGHPPDKVGTSPVWDARNRRVVWGDSLGGAVNWLGADGDAGRLPMPSLPGAVVAYDAGRALVASRDGISIVDYLKKRRITLSHPEPDDALRRFSVAKIGPDGRVWVGTLQPVAAEGAANGRLYAFGRDGQIKRMLNLERGAKGLCWSPDGNLLYLTEAGSQTILRFEMDRDTGRPVNPRRFARHIGAGTPNGIAMDIEGCVWAAIYGGWQIARFDQSGALIGSIELPVPLPTGLCFSGKGLQDLFVSNCRMHVPPEVLDVAPNAGKPLWIKVQTAGAPQPEFKMF